MPAKLIFSCVLALVLVAASACGPDGGSSMRQPGRSANRNVRTVKPKPNAHWWVPDLGHPLTRTPEVDRLLTQLDTVRAACEFYRTRNRNRYPDFGVDGWTPLIEGNFLRETPRNPLSPPAVQSKILVVQRTDITGANVDPKKAGWVWVDRGQMGGVMFATGVRH
ncbi:MAG: hypothetical protein ACYS0D_07245 [Planctomycetota bacterium]|jgi:hypothetical protein